MNDDSHKFDEKKRKKHLKNHFSFYLTHLLDFTFICFHDDTW